jgi:Zn-dependent protease
MFGKGIKLFKVLGFEVRVDASWLLLAVLIILSLTSGYFPFHYKDLSTTSYVVMGIIGAIGLFASIIIHELCHSLVARRLGIPMKGITLFMFGGVAQMSDESRTPKAEFSMAIAGPIASIVLAGVFFAMHAAARAAGAAVTVTAVLGYLALINLILAFFNLLPAFPLDGGRVLRAALWRWKGNLRWATSITSQIGAGFGLVLMVLAGWQLLVGHIVQAVWWFLIGMFVRSAALGSYRQTLIRESLKGQTVRRYMTADPVSVPSDVTVEGLVEDYIYKHHHKLYPVTREGRVVGCVGIDKARETPREEWDERRVGDLADMCTIANTIGPDEEAAEALARMRRNDTGRLLVVDESGDLLGVVTLRDMLEYVSLRMELEEGARLAQ